MALFGLGNFGEGFIEGLATSANKALQDDIRRINLRAEKVADFQVKRTVEAQEKRKKDLEEIEDALREGEALFDDDPRAVEFAASLLQDQGSVSAYKSLIAEMRKKKMESGINPANFFARAEVDKPEATGFTISDYAKAYQGADTTLPDYRLPEDAASAGAGNLLAAIGLKPDVSKMVSEQVSEQMSAMGISGEVQGPTVSLPSIGFDSEEWSLADKDASGKIKYYNEKLVNPNLKPETRAEYEKKLQAQLGIAAESKDDDIRLSALEQQLTRAEASQRPAIQKQITAINVQKKRREAQAAVADGSDIMAVKKLDRADAYVRSQDPTLSEKERQSALDTYYTLNDEISEFGKGEKTVAQKYKERNEEHQRRQAEDRTYVAGNPEFDAEEAELERLKGISDDKSTEEATTAGITASVKAIDLITSSNKDITANIPNNAAFQKIKRLVDGFDTLSEGIANLSTEKPADGGPSEREIYEQGMAAMRSGGQPLVDAYIASLPEGSDKASAIVAAKSMGYDVSAYTVPTSVEAATTDSVTAGDDVTQQSTVSEEQAKQVIPDTPESAKNLLNRLMRTGGDIKQAIEDSKKFNYSDEFMKVLEAEAGLDTTMSSIAMEPGIDYEAASQEETTAAENDVQAALKIIDNVTGFASKEIRAISKQLGISKEAATKLHAEAMKALAERRAASQPQRSKSTKRNKGGLMSQKNGA